MEQNLIIIYLCAVTRKNATIWYIHVYLQQSLPVYSFSDFPPQSSISLLCQHNQRTMEVKIKFNLLRCM